MKLILLFFVFVISFAGFSQISADGAPIPPKKERTPLFKFTAFERNQTPSAEMDLRIRSLDYKHANTWNGYDSLTYGLSLIYLEKYDNALNQILRVDWDTITDVESLHLIQHCFLQNKAYTEFKKALNTEILANPIEKQQNIYRSRITDAIIAQKKGLWDINDSTLFPVFSDPAMRELRRDRIQFKTYVKPKTKALNDALRLFVTHQGSSKNPVLSQAYEEFGDFLHKYFYISNAYVAYSLSRQYNKMNNSVNIKLKAVKKEINARNLLAPSFRKLYGRIRPGRFNYEVLKEQKLAELNKEEKEIVLPPTKKKQDYLPWLDKGLWIVVGFFLILLFVIFFVRTKK